jgi:transposase
VRWYVKAGVLFELSDSDAKPRPEPIRPTEARRVLRAERHQVRCVPTSLNALLPDDHAARSVWKYVTDLTLSGLYEPIRSVEGRAGRPAIDPQILLTLWLYATTQGVGSARALERLCRHHAAYRWICGGVGVGHNALSVFRTRRVEVLDQLLTQSVAVLQHEGLVDLKRVAQDGMRVRASAGAASFRRRKTLAQCLVEAEEQVDKLRREIDEDPSATSKRQRAAKERAARDRAERVKAALKQLPEVEAKKKSPAKREKARVSTTDPDARVMKMPDGGFRPAFNVQLAVDTTSQVIVGVDVTNKGSDLGEMPPMVEQLQDRYDATPAEVLVDGGFFRRQDIETVAAEPYNCTIYAPVPQHKKSTLSPHEPRPKDGPAVAQWRRRMGTDEAKEIYKERAATVECVNAIARNRGLLRFRVRGLSGATSTVLLYALAHNVVRTIVLAA